MRCSREGCAACAQTLIVNLPGSPKSAGENLEAILAVLPHALDLLTESPDSEAGHHLKHA